MVGGGAFRYKDGKWLLSHYDGSGPAVMELSLTKDGTLKLKRERSRAGNRLIAYRTEVARAKGLCGTGGLHHSHHHVGSQ